MTDEQINRAIAEACGWKCAGHPDQLKATSGWKFGYQFVIRPDGQIVTHNSIPDFCNNLNAIHQAETVHCMGTNWDEYVLCLGALCGNPIYATARQRAEAFLRTLGKWEEVSK